MYLLDTNVISELRKIGGGKADPRVVAWTRKVPADLFHLSVISVHEIEIGVLRKERRDRLQGRILRVWLEQHVLPAFAGRLLPIDEPIVRRSAALLVPDPRPVLDALIAATALVHGLTLVTRNVSDFASTGVALIDPWS